MMNVSSANPVIRKAMSDYLLKDAHNEAQSCHDTDNVVYKVFGIEDAKEVRFCYKGNATAKIMENGGKDMIDSIYKDYVLAESEWDPEYDVTLRVDPGDLPKTQKIKKSMDEETQDKIRNENDLIRIQRKEKIQPVAELISKFKMHFMSAPIRQRMMAAIEGKQLDPIEIPYRVDEKFWVIMPAKNEVQIFFAVNFNNTTDVSLGRVMLLEW